MFQGLRTAIYHVDDLEKAKSWYSKVLDKQPYVDQPFYVGFNVGGDIFVAPVLDPFGNVFGSIENPGFKIE